MTKTCFKEIDETSVTTLTVSDEDTTVLSPSPDSSTVSLSASSTSTTTSASSTSLPTDSVLVTPASSSRKRRTQISSIESSDENSQTRKFSSQVLQDLTQSLTDGADFADSHLITPSRRTNGRDLKKARKQDGILPSDIVFDGPELREVDTNGAPSREQGKLVRISSSSPRGPFDPVALKEHIVRQSSRTLKKLPHRKGFNPIAEFTEYLPNETAAMNLFDGIEPKSNTSQMIRWELNSNEDVNSWLEKKDQYIHPVEAGEWFIEWGVVYNPTYAWAKFHSCEATYDKKSDRLTLMFKSELFATGKDENGLPCFIE